MDRMGDLRNGLSDDTGGYNPFLASGDANPSAAGGGPDGSNPFLTPPASSSGSGTGFGSYDGIVNGGAATADPKTVSRSRSLFKGMFKSGRKLGGSWGSKGSSSSVSSVGARESHDENVDHASQQVYHDQASPIAPRGQSAAAPQELSPQQPQRAPAMPAVVPAAAKPPVSSAKKPTASATKRRGAAVAAAAPAAAAAAAATNVEASSSTGGEIFDPQATLPAFYEEVSKIKADLALIEEQKRDMVQLHDIAKKLTKTAELQAAQADMAKLVEDIRKGLAATNKAIQAVQKRNEIDYMAAVESVDIDAADVEIVAQRDRLTSVFQMRAQVTIGLVAKFNKTCDAFNDFQRHVSEEYHDDVRRRLQIVTNQAVDDEQVEALIESGQAETVFKQALMQSRGEAVTEFSRTVQERHEGMQKLYKDLLELHQMMLDFSVLVFEQGKMIDNIADQVGSTADYIRRGTDELLRAKAHKKRSAKVKSALGAAAGGVAAAGVAFVALSAAGLAAPLAM